jgi:hypothetical protein
MNDQAKTADNTRVTIVVSGEFVSKLDGLASCEHVWVLRTPATERVAQQIWEKYPALETDLLKAGVTLFKAEGDSEGVLLSILDEVELHHGISGGHFPPMGAVKVLGTGPTDSVREAFGLLGFTRLVSIPDGFVAHRDPS